MDTDQMILEHVISSVSELVDQLPPRQPPHTPATTVYRGHRLARWQLVPGFFRIKERPIESSDWGKFEERVLNRFEIAALPYLNSIPRNKLEWLALAQHHGLPTRLLDWTESPLAALFFAVDDYDGKDQMDGVVWSLIAFVFQGGPYNTLEELNNVIKRPNNVYFPPHVTSRISAQQGCFTVHARPDGSEFIPLEQQATTGERSLILEKWIIPAERKRKIRHELDKLGINQFSLFPDLDGLCRKLVWDINHFEDIAVEREQLE